MLLKGKHAERQASEKVFVFYKLSKISFLVGRLINAITGALVYYIEISDSMSNNSVIDGLRNSRIRWIKKEYKEYSDFAKGRYIAGMVSENILNKTRLKSAISVVDSFFCSEREIDSKMETVWKSNIYKWVEPLAFQYAAAEYLIERLNYKKVTLVAFSSLGHFLDVGRDKRIRVVALPFLSLAGRCIESLRRKKLTAYLKALYKKKRRFVSEAREQTTFPALPKVENFRSAYFPHVGIFYGNLFMKDHFYNNDPASPFHPTNMLHIELDKRRRPEYRESCEYYEKNGIPFIEFPDIMAGNRETTREFLALLCSSPVVFLKTVWKFGIDFFLLVCFVAWRMLKFRSAVRRLKNLKIALVGYDFLFPAELSAMLSLYGVQVCAAQERLIQAFYPQTYLVFDYYFVAGRIVQRKGLKNSFIGHCIPLGLTRVDRLFEYERDQIPDAKYDVIKKERKLVLALDYHMPSDDREDISRPVAKIAQIREFYTNLIMLAEEFPSLHIAIKGKERSSYDNPRIADIVQEIASIENMHIELDFDTYNPYYIAEKADLTIACHTSLADELLAAGRKVIFYEISDYMETIFNYENLPIVVKNYAGLKHHVQNFLDGVYLSQDVIDRLKRDFYSDCFHGNVRGTIRSVLERLVRDQRGK